MPILINKNNFMIYHRKKYRKIVTDTFPPPILQSRNRLCVSVIPNMPADRLPRTPYAALRFRFSLGQAWPIGEHLSSAKGDAFYVINYCSVCSSFSFPLYLIMCRGSSSALPLTTSSPSRYFFSTCSFLATWSSEFDGIAFDCRGHETH